MYSGVLTEGFHIHYLLLGKVQREGAVPMAHLYCIPSIFGGGLNWWHGKIFSNFNILLVLKLIGDASPLLDFSDNLATYGYLQQLGRRVSKHLKDKKWAGIIMNLSITLGNHSALNSNLLLDQDVCFEVMVGSSHTVG